MKNLQVLKIVLVLLLAVVLLPLGCTGEDAAPVTDHPAEPESPARNTLIIALGRDFYYGPEDRTFLHGSTNVWESLVYLDDQLNAIPWLAEDFYPSEDGLTWTFKLREGIRFHDGIVMDAEIVRANLLRLSRHPGTAQPYGALVDIRGVDPLTVEVELSAPMPAFPEMISYFSSAIFSPEVIDEENNGLKAPVGTGPYRFEDYSDDEITLSSFRDYWGGAPSIDTVIFKFVPDENTRVAALLAGEVDVLADVGVILPEQVPLLAGNPDILIFTVDVLTSIFMHYQTGNKPFDDPDLRRAVAMLMDREEIVARMLDGFGTPAKSVITQLADFWVNPAAVPGYNPVEAGQFLGSYSASPVEVKILVNSNWARRWPMLSIAQYLQTELKKTGFDAVINSLEMGAYNDAVKAGEYHITFTPWTGSDPDDFFRTWILTDGSFNKNRGMLYSNSEADRIIMKAASEMDRGLRRELYFTLQELVAAEAPISPIYHDMTVYAARNYVKNFSMDFNFRPDLHSVSFE